MQSSRFWTRREPAEPRRTPPNPSSPAEARRTRRAPPNPSKPAEPAEARRSPPSPPRPPKPAEPGKDAFRVFSDTAPCLPGHRLKGVKSSSFKYLAST